MLLLAATFSNSHDANLAPLGHLIFKRKKSLRAEFQRRSTTARYFKSTMFAKLRAAFFTISLKNDTVAESTCSLARPDPGYE